LGTARRFVRWAPPVKVTLTQLGTPVGGSDYVVVSKAITRFAHRLATDDALRQKNEYYPSPIVQMTNDKT